MPPMLIGRNWTEGHQVLFEPKLDLKVTQDDAGNVTVLMNKIQLLSGPVFLEIVLAQGEVKTTAVA